MFHDVMGLKIIKYFTGLFIVCSISLITVAQQNKYSCACSKIGLDPQWADSNNISCYLIPVLRNSVKPTDGKFLLAVALVPAINKSTESPLIYLHGGPGIATLENVPRYLKSETWKLLRENRSLVFFDYRGTGFSEPDLCPELKDSLIAYRKRDTSSAAIKSYEITLYEKCRTDLLKNKIDISDFNSSQLADDVESIRKSLDIDSINIYGVSYGTTVALNLVRNHPVNIRSMVLDSPYPPNAPWLDFIRPFDLCFKVIEQRLKEDTITYDKFRSLRNDFKNAVNRLNINPVKIGADSVSSAFTGNDFAWTVWSAMLNPKTIPLVPLAIHEAGNGNDSMLTNWVNAFNDPNSFGEFSQPQNHAVSCYESRPGKYEDTKEYLLANYPDFSSFYVDFEGELCNAWQPKSAKPEYFLPVKSNVPSLILSGEFDPVCPPLFGKISARTLSNSIFINVPSASHAAIHADDCLRQTVNNFLSVPSGKLDVSCIDNRPKLNFITGNLMQYLSDLNTK